MTKRDKSIAIGILILLGGFGIIAFICGGKGIIMEGPVFYILIIAFIALLVWLLNRKSDAKHIPATTTVNNNLVAKSTVIEAIYNISAVRNATKTNRRIIGSEFGGIRSDYTEQMLDDIYDGEHFDSFLQKIFTSVFFDYFYIINRQYQSNDQPEQIFETNVLSENRRSVRLEFKKELIIASRRLGNVSIIIGYFGKELTTDLILTTTDGTTFRTNTRMNHFPISYKADLSNFETAYLGSLDEIVSRQQFKNYLQFYGLSTDW